MPLEQAPQIQNGPDPELTSPQTLRRSVLRLMLAGTVVLLPLVAGCRSTAVVSTAVASTADLSGHVEFIVVDETLPDDDEIDAIVAPYRTRLEREVSAVIGYTDTELTKGRPESTLGNLAADAMLGVVQRLARRPVHMALTNNGGLRATVGPGDISVGRIFELMPFENMLVVLELTGAEVDTLAHQLARNGGDPIAGFSFEIVATSATARNLMVGGQPVSPDSTYRLVTSDYLADGGGPYEILSSGALPRQDMAYLVRDAIIEHIRDIQQVKPVLDGRIRMADK